MVLSSYVKKTVVLKVQNVAIRASLLNTIISQGGGAFEVWGDLFS